MYKTSVYLDPVEAERLRRTATRTGRSQAELIREGVRLVTANTELQGRTFRSLGQGHGGHTRHRPWDAEELYRSVMGER